MDAAVQVLTKGKLDYRDEAFQLIIDIKDDLSFNGPLDAGKAALALFKVGVTLFKKLFYWTQNKSNEAWYMKVLTITYMNKINPVSSVPFLMEKIREEVNDKAEWHVIYACLNLLQQQFDE